MNTVTVTDDALVVEPRGLDKLWSFTGSLTIPWAHVRGATEDDHYAAEPKGRRGPGLHVPGKWSGTFTHDGETAFWNVSGHGPVVVVELADEHYDRLVLSVEDARASVSAINDHVPA